MRPEFGYRLNELVFAPNNAQTIAQAERIVRLALGRWEPRIQVEQVTAVPDAGDGARLVITVRYTIRTIHSSKSLVYPFYIIPEE